MNRASRLTLLLLMALFSRWASPVAGDGLRVGVFSVDASPPVGSPLAYDPCVAVSGPLLARGLVLLGDQAPIVLCAVDWIGIANDGQTVWKDRLAAAAGTTSDRVAVHALHQHDAPVCDFSAEQLLEARGLGGVLFDPEFARGVIDRVAQAVEQAVADAQGVSHLGLGQARVEKVASNRRIMDDQGRVRATRYTSCADPELRAEPEGLIDPQVKMISFWHETQPLAVLTYYATHPQSYYRTGVASPDFPGMARTLRELTLNGLPHVHFNGAGGNIGAGKYNDGSPENRQILAVRLAEGMAAAWQATERQAITAADVSWNVQPVHLPAAPHLHEADLLAILDDAARSDTERATAATALAWLQRCQQHASMDVSCLQLGNARILHLPGEAVVEYQLAAQALRPDLFVAVAAYGDYAPGYICLQTHYGQGGYEDSPRASLVGPGCEQVLSRAIDRLLN